MYLTYKYIHPRTSRVNLYNLTAEDYVLEDLSMIELEESLPPVPTAPRYPEHNPHELAALTANGEVSNGGMHRPFSQEQMYANMRPHPEFEEEAAAQEARIHEAERIAYILMRRPRRWERGVWREIWSFVVTDKE